MLKIIFILHVPPPPRERGWKTEPSLGRNRFCNCLDMFAHATTFSNFSRFPPFRTWGGGGFGGCHILGQLSPAPVRVGMVPHVGSPGGHGCPLRAPLRVPRGSHPEGAPHSVAPHEGHPSKVPRCPSGPYGPPCPPGAPWAPEFPRGPRDP